MKQWESWSAHVATILVTASGLAYLWMKYGIVNDDPFSVLNHPWQPAMLSLHLLSAPLLVFVVGLIAQSHIRRKLSGANRSNRRSGLASLITLPAMVLSGYGLQILSDPFLIRLALILHLVSSAIFALNYVVHLVISSRLLRRSDTRQDARVLVRTA